MENETVEEVKMEEVTGDVVDVVEAEAEAVVEAEAVAVEEVV